MKKVSVAILAGVAALSLALSGCSGGGASANAPADKTLTIALPSPPVSLDPSKAATGLYINYVEPTYASLLNRATDGTIVEGLADKWGYVGDGNTDFEFSLRDGVKWADGSPITADRRRRLARLLQGRKRRQRSLSREHDLHRGGRQDGPHHQQHAEPGHRRPAHSGVPRRRHHQPRRTEGPRCARPSDVRRRAVRLRHLEVDQRRHVRLHAEQELLRSERDQVRLDHDPSDREHQLRGPGPQVRADRLHAGLPGQRVRRRRATRTSRRSTRPSSGLASICSIATAKSSPRSRTRGCGRR